jgi:hypothetical protein
VLERGVDLNVQLSALTSDRAAQQQRRVVAHGHARHRHVLDRHAQELLQLAARVQLLHDVAAALELAVHVELRDGRPVRELLDALSDLPVREHVELAYDGAGDRGSTRPGPRSALRRVGAPLHEEHDTVGPDDRVEALAERGIEAHGFIPL